MRQWEWSQFVTDKRRNGSLHKHNAPTTATPLSVVLCRGPPRIEIMVMYNRKHSSVAVENNSGVTWLRPRVVAPPSSPIGT